MPAPKPVGEEKTVYEGRIFEVVQQPHQVGEKVIDFEKARRAPGVRLIISRDEKILLSKEFRSELETFDYRLPGGKVFDALSDYQEALATNADMLEAAKEAARREAKEEVGHVVNNLRHVHTTSPGATVSWDLFYFVAEDSSDHEQGQHLEHGEVIEPEWFTKSEVKEMCLDGRIQEERSVAVLLRYLDGRYE